MRKLINTLFLTLSFTTILLLILLNTGRMFGYKLINLWDIFSISCNSSVILFLIFILFGGKITKTEI